MVAVLLKHGANPNSESGIGWRPLYHLSKTHLASGLMIIDILIQYNARLTDKREINNLRITVETNGTKDLAIKVREVHPRDREKCEKCIKPTPKQCGACGKVYYCSPACQKMDWKFHKVSCKKEKQ